MERIKTGIKGFDGLIEGGFPKGKIMLLRGSPGTCKTIFALQFLHNGVKKFNEKGLYVTFEERVCSLKNQAAQFGWDIDTLEKEEKILMMNIFPKNVDNKTPSQIIKVIRSYGIKRLVVDSLSSLAINTPVLYPGKKTDLTEISIEQFLYRFINDLRDLEKDTTSLLISQKTESRASKESVSDFICDGIIDISHESLGGKYSRSLTVPKMRETKNDEDVHPIEVTDKGIIVHALG